MYEHYQALLDELNRRRAQCGPTDGDAGRELSLAITSLEDSWTRANAATYRKAGTYHRTDSDELNPGTWF